MHELSRIPEEVIVVEGRDDTKRLIETYGNQVKTIETNGSAIDTSILQRIKRAQEQFGVIVFTDPDFAGQKIRRTIIRAVPQAKEAFLTQEEANPHRRNHSLGIEHASPAAIRQAIDRISQRKTDTESEEISQATLIKLKLIGHPKASMHRKKLAQVFNLGHVNGKQLRKQLMRYGITEEQLVRYMKEVDLLEEGS